MGVCRHHDSSSFESSRREPDGRQRMICPNCFRFMGYTADDRQQASMKRKEKERAKHGGGGSGGEQGDLLTGPSPAAEAFGGDGNEGEGSGDGQDEN